MAGDVTRSLVSARIEFLCPTGSDDVDGGRGEAVRVPQADGTLVVLPVGADAALIPSLLTLSDVMGTGHHAVAADVGPRKDGGRCRRWRRRLVRLDDPQVVAALGDHGWCQALPDSDPGHYSFDGCH